MKKLEGSRAEKSHSKLRTAKVVLFVTMAAAAVFVVGLRNSGSANANTPAKMMTRSAATFESVAPSNLASSRHLGKKRNTPTRTPSVSPDTTTTNSVASNVSATTIYTPVVPTAPRTIARTIPAISGPTSPAATTTVPATTTTTAPNTAIPLGVPSNAEPSGLAPPTANELPGFSQSYFSDFTGTSLPAGWDVYTGSPGGDPGGQWGQAHVVVENGLLSLNAWLDPSYNNSWVTGGLCQCGVQQTYGAYFVRSKVTGVGPTGVELLWPAAGVWPPEIDFNETSGMTSGTSATVHYGASNHQDQRRVSVDMTQWHTWGVIWTPVLITYTLDGKIWGVVTNAAEIPNQAMTLDLQQQTWCSSGWACPSAPQSMQIDWVVEYKMN